jgi:hypothetical protein
MRALGPVVLIAALGCFSLRPEGWGGTGGSSSYTTNQGTVHRGLAALTRNGQPYLVMLTAGGQVTQVLGGPPGSGTIHTPDDRTLKWTCDTRDGVLGKVAIDGQPFRLENGPVFLVDLRGGKMVVEQLAVTPEFLREDVTEQQLKTDDRIARFFARTELPK